MYRGLLLWTCRYMFDMPKMEAEELRTIKKADVIAWYDTYIRSPAPKRRRLAIHVYGCNADIAEAAKLQEQFWTAIDNVQSFKVSSQFYSSICWGWGWHYLLLWNHNSYRWASPKKHHNSYIWASPKKQFLADICGRLDATTRTFPRHAKVQECHGLMDHNKWDPAADGRHVNL